MKPVRPAAMTLMITIQKEGPIKLAPSRGASLKRRGNSYICNKQTMDSLIENSYIKECYPGFWVVTEKATRFLKV